MNTLEMSKRFSKDNCLWCLSWIDYILLLASFAVGGDQSDVKISKQHSPSTEAACLGTSVK